MPEEPERRETREHRVSQAESGRRLDRVLADRWPDLSRTQIARLMKQGHVTIAGKSACARDAARAGAVITVELPAPEPTALAPEEIPLAILYEDEHLLVVNKPAGMVVHPGAGNRRGTLVHALLAHAPGIAHVGGAGRPGIVHRLDKDTSGVLVVAKTQAAYLRLVEAIARREVSREYLALVWGEPRDKAGRIAEPVGRHPKDRKRMAVTPKGRVAATNYRVLQGFGWATYVECRLETGRTHQIRVHMSHLGHPLLGDATYGGGARRVLNLPESARRLAREIVETMPRQALHAARLAFSHPATGERLALEAPLPADFSAALDRLRKSVAGATAVSSSGRIPR
jgi:23S rRNA pseudouridine1911/1915/1917 synthase